MLMIADIEEAHVAQYDKACEIGEYWKVPDIRNSSIIYPNHR